MLKKTNPPLKEVSVYLEFDKSLKELVGADRAVIKVSDGTPLLMFIQAVLESYPSIYKKYPVSNIGFSLNGAVPMTDSLLTEHDFVTMHLIDRESDLFEINFGDQRH